MNRALRVLHGSVPLASLLVSLLVGALQPPARTAEAPPNLVLILADDMGYECVGANGGTSYATPALDRLAREGMRFEHCYSQPLCTPSRVQLMTGIYNQRNYVRFGYLDPGATTFAQLLKKRGYRTCVAGKWQLRGGFDAPGHFGFDAYCLWQLTVRRSRYPNPVIERDGKVVEYKSGEYGPDVVSDFICDFMARHRREPFLVYYPMILPHWPFEPTPDSSDWDAAAAGVLKGQGEARYFADMVGYTDKMVGKIVRKIDELGLGERTLVLFTGDNGTAVGIASRLGDREVTGAKGSMTDAGTHVPLIARWPGTVSRGAVCRDLVDFSDFLPTLLEAARLEAPAQLELDGRSFLSQLRGEPGSPREWIYSWYSRSGGPAGRESARTRRFKLYGDGRFFDVPSDWLEEHDLSGTPLDEAAARARRRLQNVLDRFKGTRKVLETSAVAPAAEGRREAAVISRLEELGGHIFRKDGRVVEVNLNHSGVSDEDLRLVGALSRLTDLSLEGTGVGDQGMAALARLGDLEWLNLYRTRVGDDGLGHLRHLGSLKLLPIGGSRVTDAGLEHAGAMPQLEYLGLRANDITDAGLKKLSHLENLKGLHLGETRVSDAGLRHLRALERLEKLWLDDTLVSDEGIDDLARLTSLRELHLSRTRVSPEGVARLRKALARCRIVATTRL